MTPTEMAEIHRKADALERVNTRVLRGEPKPKPDDGRAIGVLS